MRMDEAQNAKDSARNEVRKQMEMEQKIDSILNNVLTTQARERLNNVKLVNNNVYMNAVQSLIMAFNSGNIREQISDEELKDLLQKISAGTKKDFKITRK